MTDINRIIDRVLVLDKELNTNLPFEKKIAIWATLEIEMVASAVLIARECERLRRLTGVDQPLRRRMYGRTGDVQRLPSSISS